MPRTVRRRTARNGGITANATSANTIITVVVLLIAAAIIGGALLLGGSDNSGTNGSNDDGGVSERLLRQENSHTLTEATDGKVTVVEFLDYQCSACAGYYTNITKKLESDYSGRITFVTRNFPLEIHPLALPAAQAAEAAGAQGKYREMYRALYDNYLQWAVAGGGDNVAADTDRARAQFEEYARAIGLDVERFRRDAGSPEIAERIDADMADGEQAGVESTPTLFVNGEKFQPRGNSYADVNRQLRALLDRELGA